MLECIFLHPKKNLLVKAVYIMNELKKSAKDANILMAAEKVFNEVGYKNAKMEDIAKHAGITKVTLYTYFQSKENLYLALTHKALSMLIEKYYETIDKHKDKSGMQSAIALLETFMIFCEQHHLYSEVLLDYYSLVRSTGDGTVMAKMTEAVKDSIYWLKLQDMQNLPFKLTVKEIERGKKDGSIIADIDSALVTVQGWIMVMGYVKIRGASGQVSIFKVDMDIVKQANLAVAKLLFQNKNLY
jgi:AcrR family transcriptional regulator